MSRKTARNKAEETQAEVVSRDMLEMWNNAQAQVLALRARGEVYAQLPADERAALDDDLIRRARAHDIDTSKLEPEA